MADEANKSELPEGGEARVVGGMRVPAHKERPAQEQDVAKPLEDLPIEVTKGPINPALVDAAHDKAGTSKANPAQYHPEKQYPKQAKASQPVNMHIQQPRK